MDKMFCSVEEWTYPVLYYFRHGACIPQPRADSYSSTSTCIHRHSLWSSIAASVSSSFQQWRVYSSLVPIHSNGLGIQYCISIRSQESVHSFHWYLMYAVLEMVRTPKHWRSLLWCVFLQRFVKSLISKESIKIRLSLQSGVKAQQTIKQTKQYLLDIRSSINMDY